MKRFFLTIAIFLLSVSISFAALPFTKDIIVTSPDGIWTDTRAYTTLNLAIAACGTDIRTIVIPTDQTVTALTVPVTITLRFERDGSITNSGQLTLNTSKIEADSHQIFTGTGDIDFLAGTTVKSSWFADLDEALDVTSDDTVTILISAAETTDADMAVGDDVTLRWESPFIITVDAGDTLSNVKNIEAGDYQILSGAGEVDFLDGTALKISWFNRLRTAIAWIGAAEVTLIVNAAPVAMDMNAAILATTSTIWLQGCPIPLATFTLTANGFILAGDYALSSGAGTFTYNGGGLSFGEWQSGGGDTMTLDGNTITPFAFTLLDDLAATNVLTTLGVTAFVKTLLDDATAAAFMTTLGITSNGQSLITAADFSTFSNAATGIPAVSATVFDVDAVISDAWETVGPTGSEATNIWTALDGVPTDVDWIELRILHSIYTTGETPGDLISSSLYGRDSGSTATNGFSTMISLCSTVVSSTGILRASNTTAGVKIPATSAVFELYMTGPAYDIVNIILTGYGYN